jgi:hypothetical protein
LSDFIKCSKGHVYDSELKECPYCSGKELKDDLNKLPLGKKFPLLMAMCYDRGEFRIIDKNNIDDNEY